MAGLLTRRLCIKTLVRDRKYSTTMCTSIFNTSATFYNHPKQVLMVDVKPLVRYYSQKQEKKVNVDETKCKNEVKPTLFQRFKQMYKDYWYVLVPVHLVTSIGWFGSFYYLAKSGVDVVALLEQMHVSESITKSMKHSSMGYVAIAYGLYKIATPLRYTVTLGGTTISINYLQKWGLIKPVASSSKIKEMCMGKISKTKIIESVKEKTKELKQQKNRLMDKKPTQSG